MNTIGDLLTRDLSRKIEEIIQVDQTDEQSVHDEITEYVATDSIREQYHHILKAVAEAPTDPDESVGVWVSGFFGSGKSSFAKNLGYALENRTVLGSKFADLFKKQLGDTVTSDLLDSINAKTPTEVILFEVAKESRCCERGEWSGMNQEIRNKLRSVVTQCRKLLEDSVSKELEGKYGIFERNDRVTADPNASTTHLTDEERESRKDILDHFGHIQARSFKAKDALDQMVREIAEPLQVAMDNGARKALIPLENKRNFLEVSGDIVERVDPVFFSDPTTAAMKALGMT